MPFQKGNQLGKWAPGSGGQIKHGHARLGKNSRTYYSWIAMWARCTNKNRRSYPSYGGRGVTIHPEWAKFENFLRDMGERPLNMTLDRINPFEGYELLNCRWADAQTQSDNKRRNKNVA